MLCKGGNGKFRFRAPLPRQKMEARFESAPSKSVALADHPNTQHALGLLELGNDLVGCLLVQIQHGIGVCALGAVEHIRDVDIAAGHDGSKAGDGVGNVVVENAETAGLGALAHVAVGEIHGVQDIAVLKGQGFDILSTHNGYLVQKSPFKDRVFKVKHSTDQTEDELSTIVELGGTVVDVFVWHKVYGKMSAPLNIFSELQIKQFIEGIRAGKSTELMNITGGYHYHTVRAEKEETLDLIAEVLSKKGYVAPEI